MTTENNKRVGRYDLITPMLPCKNEILEKFEKFLMSGNYILGEEVRLLEEELAAACGVVDAVGVASGSSALFVALAMAGVRPGDEVITTPYTFDATMESIVLLDAVPVFVDILPEDLNMDPINEIAERHGLQVVVDMAQGYGTLYKGQPMGAFGRMSTLSFYPTKNLPGIGDGGMVLCRDQVDADRIRKIRAHQTVRANDHLYSGWNSRLDEVQAMVIRVRNNHFADEQGDRDQVGAIYDSYIPAANRLQFPIGPEGMKVTHHQYWVRCSRRDDLQRHLDANGIDTAIYYDPPLHKHELAVYARNGGDLVEAERAGREVLILPIHAAVPFEDAHRIGKLVRDFLGSEEKTASS